MKRWLLSLLFGGCASAQIVSIATGSPVPVAPYTQDQYFTGGTARPLDTTIGTGIYQTTRFGTNFSYHIPVAPGVYSILLRLSDPTSTGIGQRVFTVTVNGNTSAPIDLFALIGARTPYTLPLYAVAGAGFIDLTFKSTVGNATVSGIDVYGASIALGFGNAITENPCPTGWLQGKLSDGNCLVAVTQ
jgi:hypothetical protein